MKSYPKDFAYLLRYSSFNLIARVNATVTRCRGNKGHVKAVSQGVRGGGITTQSGIPCVRFVYLKCFNYVVFPFFLGWRTSNIIIIGLSGWWAPNWQCRTKETVPHRRRPNSRPTRRKCKPLTMFVGWQHEQKLFFVQFNLNCCGRSYSSLRMD